MMFKPTDKDIDRAFEGILADRWNDVHGWFKESFTEASDTDLIKLRDLLRGQDFSIAGKLLYSMCDEYMKPDPTDVFIAAIANGPEGPMNED